jgi:hypothetical protein
MQTDENNEHEPKENKLVFAYANPWYFLFLIALCTFEYVFIKRVWFMPNHAIDLFMKICLQVLVLGPVYAGLIARTEMKKKLKAGEISPAYASELSSWLVGQFFFVYMTFTFLVEFIPR